MRKRQANAGLTPRQAMQNKYKTARNNLLLMLILTVLNVALLFADTGTMFLFSASVPYYAIAFGWLWDSLFVLAIGVMVLVGFFLSWLLSKKNYAWMIVALVLFALDTVATLWIYSWIGNFASGILDIVIHGWVLFYLILGVINGNRLAKLPQEIEEETAVPPLETAEQPVSVAALNGESIEE